MVRTKYNCGCILETGRRCRDHKNLDIRVIEEENERIDALLQHIADNTRLGEEDQKSQTKSGRKLRDNVSFFIFFMPNPVGAGQRILHISFCETLSENEKQVINNRFPGLVMSH